MGGDRIEDIEKLLDRILLAIEEERLEEAQEGIERLSSALQNISADTASKIAPRVDYIARRIEEKKAQTLTALSEKEKLLRYKF